MTNIRRLSLKLLLLIAILLTPLPTCGTPINGMSDKWNIISTYDYLGEFTVTYYCDCEICNGSWTGMPAANGEELQENYTIAVDPKVIPLNSWVEIDGKMYKACDTGSAIKGYDIDIFVNDHDLCYEKGKHKADVYMLEWGDN